MDDGLHAEIGVFGGSEEFEGMGHGEIFFATEGIENTE
jgi:hypothetical protein